MPASIKDPLADELMKIIEYTEQGHEREERLLGLMKFMLEKNGSEVLICSGCKSLKTENESLKHKISMESHKLTVKERLNTKLLLENQQLTQKNKMLVEALNSARVSRDRSLS